jgi:hypothetical protein
MNDTDIKISIYDETNLVEHPKHPEPFKSQIEGW